MSGKDMRDFMKHLSEEDINEYSDEDLQQYFDTGGGITKVRPGKAGGITKTGRIVGKGNTGHLPKGSYSMSANQRKSAETNDKALRRVTTEGRRGSLMQISDFQAKSIWDQPDVKVKCDMALDLIKNFRTNDVGKYRERTKIENMTRPEQVDAWVSNMLLHGEDLSSARITEGLAIQLNEMVMADLNNPYELTIQLEEAEEKENLVRVLADRDIKFSKEKLVDTNQIFYFDTEATLKQANEALEAWGWKTNLSEKKKRKQGKALSTMGGADSQGRHSNIIGGDYRKPKNTGVSANPGFFGEDVELDEGAFPSIDKEGRVINKHVFTVTNEFPIFKLVGRAKTNASYGSARITAGVYQKDTARSGEQVHFMHQTMYLVSDSSTYKMRLSPPPGPFERDSSYPDYALKGLMDKGMLTMEDPSAAFPANYNIDSLEQYPDYTPGVLEDAVEYEPRGEYETRADYEARGQYEPRVEGLGQQLSDMYYMDDDDMEEDYIEDPNGKVDADYIEDESPEDNEMEEGPSSLFHKMLQKTKKTRR